MQLCATMSVPFSPFRRLRGTNPRSRLDERHHSTRRSPRRFVLQDFQMPDRSQSAIRAGQLAGVCDGGLRRTLDVPVLWFAGLLWHLDPIVHWVRWSCPETPCSATQGETRLLALVQSGFLYLRSRLDGVVLHAAWRCRRMVGVAGGLDSAGASAGCRLLLLECLLQDHSRTVCRSFSRILPRRVVAPLYSRENRHAALGRMLRAGVWPGFGASPLLGTDSRQPIPSATCGLNQ